MFDEEKLMVNKWIMERRRRRAGKRVGGGEKRSHFSLSLFLVVDGRRRRGGDHGTGKVVPHTRPSRGKKTQSSSGRERTLQLLSGHETFNV